MLKEKLKDYTIILASGSPRRQEYFKALGIDFKIQLKPVEEVYPEHLKGTEITDYLAELKSAEFNTLSKNDIVITSDTIVWLNNKALGKPKDSNDAKAMIAKLSNKTHEVMTSICFKSATHSKVLNHTTKVTFRALSKDAINYYVNQYNPLDKAGAYGIQDWIGLIGIEKIEGNYSNVVGMPMYLVYEELLKISTP